ncbi:glycosyltransferase [candidate division KSB1 bacterium]
MKKVLIIVNQFPPFGGGGVIRVLKFVKYLPEFDWEPIVLTRDFSKNLFVQDEDLLKEISSKTKIFRVPSLEPTGLTKKLKNLNNGNGNSKTVNNSYGFIYHYLKKIRDFIFRTILIPDQDILWVKRAIKKAEEIIKEEKIDVIFSSSPPDSTHLVGYFLKKRFPELKWVTDYRDTWYFRDGYKKSGIRKRIYLFLEKKMVNSSDGTSLVHNTIQNKDIDEIKDNLKSKIVLIPNGFDEEDFKNINNGKTNEIFTLTYAGSILGYRKNQSLLEALKLFKGHSGNGKINVKLMGIIDEDYKEEINQLDLNDIVKVHGFLSHKEALEQLSNSHAILFVQTSNKEESIVPSGKIYEYLRIGKPIFALVQDGVVKNIINQFKAGLAVDPDNPEEIIQGLEELKRNYTQYDNLQKIDTVFLKQHERKELTRQLAELFNRF